jgi:hypothetical protein
MIRIERPQKIFTGVLITLFAGALSVHSQIEPTHLCVMLTSGSATRVLLDSVTDVQADQNLLTIRRVAKADMRIPLGSVQKIVFDNGATAVKHTAVSKIGSSVRIVPTARGVKVQWAAILPGELRCTIYNQVGSVVKEWGVAGTSGIEWDGSNNQGVLASTGVYTLIGMYKNAPIFSGHVVIGGVR